MSKAQETVELLNELFWEREEDHHHYFIYAQHGSIESISLNVNYNVTIDLWNDQDDSRIWIEDFHEYEDLSIHILRELKKAAKKLKEVSNFLNQ